MAAWLPGIAKIGKVGHAASSKIFAEGLRRIGSRKYGGVKLPEFPERKRIDDEFNISAGKIGSQFPGKKSSIRTGDVNITCLLYTSR